MNIAIVGYGKMGKAVEEAAVARGHKISLIVGSENKESLKTLDQSQTDIAIEFSSPDSAVENLKAIMGKGIPTVCGTTGWIENLPLIRQFCIEKDTAFLYASNFSIGVNIFFEINSLLAKLADPFQTYDCSIEEIHHLQKKDAPSGTAITLAEQIIGESSKYKEWALAKEKLSDDCIPIESKRIESVVGTHEIKYSSSIDEISIRHQAHDRKGFAEGSVIAAEWLLGRKGCFSMRDVLFSAAKVNN